MIPIHLIEDIRMFAITEIQNIDFYAYAGSTDMILQHF